MDMFSVGLLAMLVFGTWRLWQWRDQRESGPLVLIAGAVMLAVVAVVLIARLL